ncbi:MAG: hypothetical protein ACREJO_17555 [Phycisphaerales bacterium]
MPNMHAIVAGLAISTLSVAALAQPPAAPAPAPKPADKAPEAPKAPADAARPAQGGQLSAEKSKAAWELEANGVAKRLALKDEVTKPLVKAYTDARTSQNDAYTKLRDEQRKARQEGGGGGGGGGGGAEMRTAMEAMNKKEKEKFEKALPAGLSPDQKTKVLASLGSFNMQWDRMADAIAGFKLEPAKQQTALDAIEDNVLAIAKLNAAATGENPDREAQRAARTEARTKLDEALKKVLSEEQMKKFEEANRPAGRNPGGGGGGGGGGGRPGAGRGGQPGGGGGN